jgi:hypothetical protein
MDYIDEEGNFTDDFRNELPDRLGDVYYNDPDTKQTPTKELDNVKNIFDLAKMVITGSRKISAHGTELKRATEGMIKIPGEGATEEDIKAYRKAIGVPEKQEDYELAIPETNDESENAVNKKLADKISAAAFKANIPKSKLQSVFNEVMSEINSINEAEIQKGMKLLAADVQALKDAKKEKYDAFIADTNRVAAELDVKGDLDAGRADNPIGTNFMKLMDNMGIKDTPVIREFLGAIAPLVLEGKTIIGGPTPTLAGEGGFDYQYDEHGKPIV